jgi:cellobiose epimerase
MDRKQLRESIEQELHSNLLPFWRERVIDRDNGGFIAEMTINGALNGRAPKGLILNARLLWTFSTLYRELSDARDLELANRAYHYLNSYFRDYESRGYFWRVAQDGQTLDASKKIYGQAFCIYALSEYFQATHEAEALHAATDLFDLVECHAYDHACGGYTEVLAKNWTPARDQRLSDKDLDAAKSMNNHLHILEAYTNLYRVWPDLIVANRLRELLDLFGSKMLTTSGHFDLFFNEDWTVCSGSYTYGHDIEGAWLLREAAEALHDGELLEKTARWVDRIAGAVEEEALNEDGGIAYEGRRGGVIDAGCEWWPQAEAMLGFWCACRILKKDKYAEVVVRLWEFIQRRIVDRQQGEWFWRILADGSVDQKQPKVSEWKDPYHGVRMCLKMMHDLED